MAGRREEEQLLSVPMLGDESFQKKFSRRACEYENLSGHWKVERRRYERQYANVYFSRLSIMQSRVKEVAEKKWSKLYQSLTPLFWILYLRQCNTIKI